MAKTRSLNVYPPIKTEKCEDKLKIDKLLHGTNNKKNNKSKITKNNTPNKSVVQPQTSASTSSMPTLASSRITSDQIEKLISYAVIGKLNLSAASRKAGMAYSTAHGYYKKYQNDPERKIPLPKPASNKQLQEVTQNQIRDLIKYVFHDKITITQAAKSIGIDREKATSYCEIYLEDPERKLPASNTPAGCASTGYTEEQISNPTGYLFDDSMSLKAAPKIVIKTRASAKQHHLKHLKNPKNRALVSTKYSIAEVEKCTNDQVKTLITCIVSDGMTFREASARAGMDRNTANKYYRQYLDDSNSEIPTPESNSSRGSKTQSMADKMKKFFTFIIVEKLNIPQASRKANISEHCGYRQYKKHLKNPIEDVESTAKVYSVEKMKKLVEHIQNDNMSIYQAAIKVKLNQSTARRCYRQYLKDPQQGIPMAKIKSIMYEDIKRLIDYVEKSKMTVRSAAKKVNISEETAYKYYHLYQRDPEHKIPIPTSSGQTSKRKKFDENSKIISDIYKSNPQIKPMHENRYIILE